MSTAESVQASSAAFDDVPMETGNYSMSEDEYSYYSSASSEGGSSVDGIGAGIEANLTATAEGESAEEIAAAVEEAVVEAGVATAEVATVCSIVGGVAGVISVVIGLTALLLAYLKKYLITVQVANGTPYAMQYNDLYINHGKQVSFDPNVLTPAVNGTYYGGTFAFSNDSGSLFGPSGAFSLVITDPANGGATLGTLCIGYSDPVDGSNNVGVAFNQDLSSWFSSFNSSSPQLTTSATLQAQTINNVDYPAIIASCGLNSLSGSTPSATINLTS